MRDIIESMPGHTGFVAARLRDGTVVDVAEAAGPVQGYLAACECGWLDQHTLPANEQGRTATAEQWWRAHAIPMANTEVPGWLLVKSDVLREQVEILLANQPESALKLLAEVDGWRRQLTERAVASARERGLPWSTVGSALGISRQAAHERFAGAVER
jgi:hypothetical protein